jgi:hypothetical protein
MELLHNLSDSIEVESILVGLPLLLLPCRNPLLCAVQVFDDRCVAWRILDRLGQIFQRGLIALLSNLGLSSPVVSLRLVLVTDALDLECLGCTVQCLGKLTCLILEQCEVEVYGYLERIELGEQVGWVVLKWRWVFVQIS